MRTKTIASPAVAIPGSTTNPSNANVKTGSRAPSAATVASAGPTTFARPGTTAGGGATGAGGGGKGAGGGGRSASEGEGDGDEEEAAASACCVGRTSAEPIPSRKRNSSTVRGRWSATSSRPSSTASLTSFDTVGFSAIGATN